MLKLRLLGELAVERGGGAVRLPPSRKTRALLGYLALTGRPQRRDRLVQMFWDVPDDPRGALRWSLSKLREVVDEPGRERLTADREVVALVVDDEEVDLLQLRKADRDLASAELRLLQAAADSAAGDLMAGLDLPDCAAYQAWLVAERDQAAALRRRVLNELMRRAGGDRDLALKYAAMAVQLDPDDAEAQANLDRLRQTSPTRNDPQQTPAVADVPQPSAAELTRRLLSRPAVAVLPFENLSNDPGQDYFADGIADDLITALCHWRWFPVISRNSTFAYKGRRVDAMTVGRDLGARYIVQGSVRRASNRVRISAQLVDAVSDHHIWADRYDRELGDIFELQDELTQRIVTCIEPELARTEQRRAEAEPVQRIDSWDLNLRALALMRRGRPADLSKAKELLTESLALDERSSRTHALLAYCLQQQALLGWTADPVAASGTYLSAARRAVELDASNWLGHTLLGLSVLWHDRDFDAAAESTRRAVELNPSAALAHQYLGCVFEFDGHPGDAIPHLQAALKLNPQGDATPLLNADLALSHLLLRNFDDAVHYARRAIAAFSGDVRAWQRLVSALGHLGQQEEAAQSLRQLLKRQPRFSRAYVEATYPFRFPDHLDLLMQGLAKAGWPG